MASVAQIVTLAARHPASSYAWDNGRAPKVYIYGMAVVYASLYCKLLADDRYAIDMAAANTGKAGTDALSWYAGIFNAHGMDNSKAGVATLRHLCVMLTGLGMRESGDRDIGHDTTAGAETAVEAEGGIWQQSENSLSASPLLMARFKEWQEHPEWIARGFADIFYDGVKHNAASMANVGSGIGEQFQQLAKVCPRAAGELAGLGLRHIGGGGPGRGHWGPINRREVQIVPVIDDLFQQVEKLVDTDCAGFALALSEDPATKPVPIPLPSPEKSQPMPAPTFDPTALIKQIEAGASSPILSMLFGGLMPAGTVVGQIVEEDIQIIQQIQAAPDLASKVAVLANHLDSVSAKLKTLAPMLGSVVKKA